MNAGQRGSRVEGSPTSGGSVSPEPNYGGTSIWKELDRTRTSSDEERRVWTRRKKVV